VSRGDRSGFLGLFHPRFDWIQVEVTTHCNATCVYCPRTAYRQSWKNRHLSLEGFTNLAPAFRKTRLIHLQGWGEPFLNPHFFEMVSMAKAAGCQVGTTTNAILLNTERIERLVGLGVDLVAFSLAGTGPENDDIRKGTRLDRVLEAIRSLTKEKEVRHATRPVIHVAYMLFRSGLADLHKLPSLVKGLGVSDVVISTLDFTSDEGLLGEVLCPKTMEEYGEVLSALESVQAEGERHGLRIHYHLAHPRERKEVCTENVRRALCISSDGAVTPCVFTNLRIADASFFLRNERRAYRRMTFGNAGERPLAEIWRGRAYKAFRDSFSKGPLAEPCRGCPKLR
jgi:MoaA/NifB/PqqE/SkfB family radical SAM enzyme